MSDPLRQSMVERVDTRTGRSRRLLDVTTELASATTPEMVGRALVASTAEVLGAVNAALWRVHGDHAVMVAHVGYSPGMLAHFQRVDFEGELPLSFALRTGESVFVSSRAEYAARFPATERGLQPVSPSRTIAFAIVPFVARGQISGAIGFTFAVERLIDEEERAFLQVLAAHAAEALQRIERMEAERRARTHAELRERVTAILARAVTPRDVARALVEESVRALGAMCGGIFALEGEQLVLVEEQGYDDTMRAFYARIPVAKEMPLTDAVTSGRPCFFSSRAEYARAYPDRESVTRAMTKPELALACVPLVVEGRVLGVLSYLFAHSRSFDDDDRLLYASLASTSAQALARARLFEAEQRARLHVTELQRTTAALSEAVTANDVARVIVENAVRVVGAQVGGVWLHERGAPALRALYTRGLANPGAYDVIAIDARVPAAQAAREGRSMRFDSIASYEVDYPEVAATVRGMGRQSYALRVEYVQLRSAAAVIVLDFPDRRMPAVDEDEFLGAVFEQCRIALDRAELFDAAREAVRVRDEFLGIAGHELNTPITTMKLQLHALRREAPSPRVEALAKQVDRLGRLASELLDVTRISAGRMVLEPEDVALDELVTDVVARTRAQIEATGSELSVDIEPVRGRWDRLRLEQVLANLVVNAAKYGGGRPIDVSLKREGGRAVLQVRDRGIGISVADQARIFERFERAVSSRNYGGLGLGLWIARQIVDLSGGSIHVASAPGEGSTFTVELPIA